MVKVSAKQLKAAKKERRLEPSPVLIVRIMMEVKRARQKFPGTKFMLAALTEEVGELHQAMIEHSCGGAANLYSEVILAEAIQVAAMAIRVAEEGDAAFEYVCPVEVIRR